MFSSTNISPPSVDRILRQHFEEKDFPGTDEQFITSYPYLTGLLLRFEYTINPDGAGSDVARFILKNRRIILNLEKEQAVGILETAPPDTLGALPYEVNFSESHALYLKSFEPEIEELNSKADGIDFILVKAPEGQMGLSRLIENVAKRLIVEEPGALNKVDIEEKGILNSILKARFYKILSKEDPEALGLKRLLKIAPRTLSTLAYNHAQVLYKNKEISRSELNILRPYILEHFGEDKEFLDYVDEFTQNQERRTPRYYARQVSLLREATKEHYQDQLYQVATNMTTNQVCSLDKRYRFLTKAKFFPHFPESLDGYSITESAKNSVAGAAYIAYQTSPASLVGSFLSWGTGSKFSLSDKLGYGVESSALAATGTFVATAVGASSKADLIHATEFVSYGKRTGEEIIKHRKRIFDAGAIALRDASSRPSWLFSFFSNIPKQVSSSAFTTLGVGISSYQTFHRGGMSDKASWQKLKKALKNDKGEKKFFKLKDDEWEGEMSFQYLDALYAFDTAFACQKLGLTDIEAYRSTDSSSTSTLKDIKIASELDSKPARNRQLLFLAGRKARVEPSASWDNFEFLKAAKKTLMSKTKHAKDIFPEGVALDDSSLKNKYKQFLVSRLSMGDVRAPEGVTQEAFAQKCRCF